MRAIKYLIILVDLNLHLLLQIQTIFIANLLKIIQQLFTNLLIKDKLGQSYKMDYLSNHLIHWEAKDDKKIQDFNYTATKEALARAIKGEPKASDVTAQKDTASHPFAAG